MESSQMMLTLHTSFPANRKTSFETDWYDKSCSIAYISHLPLCELHIDRNMSNNATRSLKSCEGSTLSAFNVNTIKIQPQNMLVAIRLIETSNVLPRYEPHQR